jgi:Fuc2NAc and GlcNAc transferase
VERPQPLCSGTGARVSAVSGLLLLAAAAAFAFLSTGLTLCLARRHALVDQPVARSAHARPVPLGGGLAIALVVSTGIAAAAQMTWPGADYWTAIALAGLGVTLVGFADDRRPMARWPRLWVHVAACVVLLVALFGGGATPVPISWPAAVLAGGALLVALVWLVNLYNFMDGIDGLAAAEAAFVSLALAGILSREADAPGALLLVCFAIAGGALGFLAWNWAPARIFMGDAGSGFLGFVLGAVALIAWREVGLTLWTPVILLAAFASDATVTLVRRMVRGEAWREPHATHAYQVTARKWKSHSRVVLAVLAIDVFWLLPLAALAAWYPSTAPLLGALAYVPVIAIVWRGGAGRSEPPPMRE